MNNSKNIVFIVDSLVQVGGGEKLLFEGVNYYRSLGFRVYICTWRFDEKSLFNGIYDNQDIVIFDEKRYPRSDIFKRGFERIKSSYSFRNFLKKIQPSLVVCQSEYDVAILYLSSLGLSIPYSFLIFGQIFQFPYDNGKYSLIFKKYLKTIINSQQGYIDTIPLKAPKMGLVNWLSNEIISIVRYFAVRKATTRFVFSKSVQWETSLLFGADSTIAKGAFRKTIFDEKYNKNDTRQYFGLPNDKKIILSFSRLDKKKRIDLVVEAFSTLSSENYLVIAGIGSELESLQKLSFDLGINDRVVFKGFIEEQDANPLKSCCDLFVSMDIGDFDISPFEAMALGVKAIMPTELDSDANLESFPNFYICKPTVKDLVNTINKAYEDDEENNYKQYMEVYSWNNYFQKILNYSLNLNYIEG